MVADGPYYPWTSETGQYVTYYSKHNCNQNGNTALLQQLNKTKVQNRSNLNRAMQKKEHKTLNVTNTTPHR